MSKHCQRFYFFFFIYITWIPIFLQGNANEGFLNAVSINEYLLPQNHPLQKKLRHLFRNPNLFASPEEYCKDGFKVYKRMNRGLMVASHPTIKNYLFKKFQNRIPQAYQLENFIKRIRGARALSAFLTGAHMKHIVVPQKWLYQLPPSYADPKTDEPSYILIVEEIDICSGGKDPKGEVAQRYYKIDNSILKELCTVLFYFRGLDSRLHNVPFTYRNKIAFIDTECWEEKREGYMLYIMPFMSKDKQEYARSVLKELEAKAT